MNATHRIRNSSVSLGDVPNVGLPLRYQVLFINATDHQERLDLQAVRRLEKCSGICLMLEE
jgi:hypothetical protein